MVKRILRKIIINILTFEAKYILQKYQPKIVAVTGSVGKTSTKDAVSIVLESKFVVRKSQKSYNSEIGVPLTVIGAESGWHKPSKWLVNIFKGLKLMIRKADYPEILVLEVGADRPGDIGRFCSWIKPDIVIVTALGQIPVHVEFFSGLEAVAQEKSIIVQCLDVDDWALLNNDDEVVFDMREKTKAKTLTYGVGKEAEVSAAYYRIFYRKDKETGLNIPEGVSFKADYKGSSVPVRLLDTFGRHHIYAALAALAAGSVLDINLVDMSEALSQYSAPPGRLKLIEGIKKTWILDDTYNASPTSMHAALDTLKDIPAARKIAVLGDMLELGRYTIEAHRALGEGVSSAVDLVFLVGPRAKFIAEAAREKGMKREQIFEFFTSHEAGKKLQNEIQEGDLILIKGSQGMRMERAVQEIMAHPEKKEELLVRQEKEWLRR